MIILVILIYRDQSYYQTNNRLYKHLLSIEKFHYIISHHFRSVPNYFSKSDSFASKFTNNYVNKMKRDADHYSFIYSFQIFSVCGLFHTSILTFQSAYFLDSLDAFSACTHPSSSENPPTDGLNVKLSRSHAFYLYTRK